MLERAYLPRQRRLGNTQALGCFDESRFLADSDEIPQVPQLQSTALAERLRS